MNRTTLILAAALALASPLSAKPLNLIAILTDDQAAWTVGCYGGREIPTPNFDRLAAQGVRFANAFTHTPVCSPSRGTYLTGLLGTQLGFTDWLNDQQSKTAGVTPAVLDCLSLSQSVKPSWVPSRPVM